VERLDKILGEVLAKKGLAGATTGALVCFYAEKWSNGRFRAISFSKGVLKVSVESSPAASELQIGEGDLVDFINDKLKKKMVRGVRIIIDSSK